MQSIAINGDEADSSSRSVSPSVPMDELLISRTASMQSAGSDSQSVESKGERDFHMNEQPAETPTRQSHKTRLLHKDSHDPESRFADHEHGRYRIYKDHLKIENGDHDQSMPGFKLQGDDDNEEDTMHDVTLEDEQTALYHRSDSDPEDDWTFVSPATLPNPASFSRRGTYRTFPRPLPQHPSSSSTPRPLSSRLNNTTRVFARNVIATSKTAASIAVPLAKTALPVAMEVGREVYESAREVYETALPVMGRMRENWPAVKELAGVIAFGKGEVEEEEGVEDDEDEDGWYTGPRSRETDEGGRRERDEGIVRGRDEGGRRKRDEGGRQRRDEGGRQRRDEGSRQEGDEVEWAGTEVVGDEDSAPVGWSPTLQGLRWS